MAYTIGVLVAMALQLYMLLFFVRMVMSWVPVINREFRPSGPLLVVFETVYTLTDPPIRFFDRIIPPIRAGGVALSLGFMVVMLLLLIAMRVNAALLLSQ